MRLNKLCVACAAALLLTGCAIGPDYVRPNLDMPLEYRTIPGEILENTTWLDARWWMDYQDPGLDTLISCALANNRTLQQTMANVERAAAAVTVTRSALFPQLGYTLEVERTRLSETTETGAALRGRPYNTRGALASASWEIDLWGKIRRQLEAAVATLGSYEAAHKAAISSVIGSVISGYLSVLMADEQLRIAEETAKSYYDTYKLFMIRAEHGNVSDLEVVQAKSQWENAKVQIPTIRQERIEYLNALSVLTGVDVADLPKFRRLSTLKVPVIAKGVPSQLLYQRPDVVEAEEELISANADIGAARALYFPTIEITGDFGFSSSKLRKLFKAPSKSWDYVGQITGPIFQWGAIRAENREADAQYMAMLASYKETVANAFADVDNSLSRRQNVVQEMKDKISLVQSLREYKRLAYAQYEEGYTSYTTVLQAEQSLLPQELDLASVRANALLSVAQIYMAMGGGWIDIALQEERDDIEAREAAEKARREEEKRLERARARGEMPAEANPMNGEPDTAQGMVLAAEKDPNTIITAPNGGVPVPPNTITTSTTSKLTRGTKHTNTRTMSETTAMPAAVATPVTRGKSNMITETSMNATPMTETPMTNSAARSSEVTKMVDKAEAKKPNTIVETPSYAAPTPSKSKASVSAAALINAVK